MSMPLPKQWDWIAVIPILVGLHALQGAAGLGSWLFSGLPGALAVASGFVLLALPGEGEGRATGYLAFAAAWGVVGVLPMWLIGGFGDALVQALSFVAAFLVAGHIGVAALPLADDRPAPTRDWQMDLKVALDEAVIGYFVGWAKVPSGEAARQGVDDAIRTGEILHENRWSTEPQRFHLVPQAPSDLHISRERLFGSDYERITFESGFIPREGLPGAARFAGYTANRTVSACVWRHAGPPRPWLICVHGYRMGSPLTDFSMFRRDYLHEHLGLNVLMPILPLHGSRKAGLRSGDHYLDGDLCDLLHAEAQTLWDLRRWLAWLRSNEHQPSIGAYGVSLGGRAVSVLAQYETGLDFVVAALPLVDVAELLWRFQPTPHRRYAESRGVTEQSIRELLAPCSPLSQPPKLSRGSLHLIGATADRVIPPAQALTLARHWDTPVHWYQGSHLSYRREALPKQVLEQAMREGGWRAGDYTYA